MKQLTNNECLQIGGGDKLNILRGNSMGITLSAPISLSVIGASLWAGNGFVESVKYGLAAASCIVYAGMAYGAIE